MLQEGPAVPHSFLQLLSVNLATQGWYLSPTPRVISIKVEHIHSNINFRNKYIFIGKYLHVTIENSFLSKQDPQFGHRAVIIIPQGNFLLRLV